MTRAAAEKVRLPPIISSSAARTGCRKLRRCRSPPRALPYRSESADRRDRQRQVDCSGRAGASAWRARLGRYDPFRGNQGRVSGIFEANPGAFAALVQAGFEGDAIESEAGELLIEREILANGKSRVFVNSRPATVALLKDLATLLGDIHGQHDQQLLFEPASQLDMLDAFAQLRERRRAAGDLFGAWKKVTGQISAIENADQEKARMLDLWQFQRKDIEAAELRAGEDLELESERRLQQNAGRLLEAAAAAFEALYESPDSALSQVRGAAKRLDEIAKIDGAMDPVRQALEPALIAVQDVAYSLRDYLGRVEANPARLEEIESRLAAIDKLKRKYGASVSEILAFLQHVAAKIAEFETAGERLEELRRERARLAAQFESAAGERRGFGRPPRQNWRIAWRKN